MYNFGFHPGGKIMSNRTELFCEKNGKLHTWHTILTGFAFLTTSIAWAIYDPYITKILNRITLIGAFFLIVVAGLPMIINIVSGGTFQGLAFSSFA